MSEPVAPPAPAAAPPAAAPSPSGFLEGSQAPAPAAAPSSLFSESVYKDNKFAEGWTEPWADKYPSAAGKLAQAKDQEGFFKLVDSAIRTASGRELKGPPSATWSEVEKADYREKFGVPETPEQYKFKPDNLEAGVHWPEETKEVTAWLHEKGVPADVVEGLGGFFKDFLKGQTDHSLNVFEDRIQQLADESKAHFSKEWGNETEARKGAIKTFLASKFTESEMQDPVFRAATSNHKILELIDQARQSTREGKIPGTGLEMPTGSHSARQQARELMKSVEYIRGDRDVVKRVTDLYAQDAAQQRASAGRR